MESQARLLDAFKRIFIITMSFLILLAAGVGWFMARRAVSGIEAVTHTAQKISGGSLQERVPVKPRGDEIDQLATTFNRMVDRIQTLLTEIKEMSDNIAHDLRSPVTRIRGTAEVTLTTGKSLDDYENMAASTIEDCDRLLDMINTMLLISKTEAGVEKPSREEVDVAALVHKACELFEPIAEEKNVNLNCAAAEKTIVSGDARMLQRMLANILDNAVKYTPSGGKNRGLSHRGQKPQYNYLCSRHGSRHLRGGSKPDFRTILPLRSESIPAGNRAGPELGQGHCPSSWRGHYRDKYRQPGQHL